MTRPFQSWLAPCFERFLAIKRAGGASYVTEANLLLRFDRYIAEEAIKAPLGHGTLTAFLATLGRLGPSGRDKMVGVVWRALAFARRHDAQVSPLPPRPPQAPAGYRVRPPRLVFDDELRSVMTAARCLGPSHQLDSATYATLYGLLFTTGMRISEALALDVGDFDIAGGLLTIRRGKFGKSRTLPLMASTVSALERYLDDSRRHGGRASCDPVFMSPAKGHKRLTYWPALRTFYKLSTTVGLAKPLPRPHDLRHSFAVLRVVEWYRQGRDLDALLPALATYLGHVSIQSTRTYLRANGLLLQEACQRFALGTARLDEVLS